MNFDTKIMGFVFVPCLAICLSAVSGCDLGGVEGSKSDAAGQPEDDYGGELESGFYSSVDVYRQEGVCAEMQYGGRDCVWPSLALSYIYQKDFGDTLNNALIAGQSLAKVEAQASVTVKQNRFAIFLSSLTEFDEDGFNNAIVSSPKIGMAVYKWGKDPESSVDKWVEFGVTHELGSFGSQGEALPFPSWGVQVFPNGDGGLLLALKGHWQKMGFEKDWVRLVSLEPSKSFNDKFVIGVQGDLDISRSECGALGEKNSFWNGRVGVYESSIGYASYCMERTYYACDLKEEVDKDYVLYEPDDRGQIGDGKNVKSCPEGIDYFFDSEDF